MVANKYDLVDKIDFSGISKAIYENDEEEQESSMRTSNITKSNVTARKDDSRWNLAIATKTSNMDKSRSDKR